MLTLVNYMSHEYHVTNHSGTLESYIMTTGLMAKWPNKNTVRTVRTTILSWTNYNAISCLAHHVIIFLYYVV